MSTWSKRKTGTRRVAPGKLAAEPMTKIIESQPSKHHRLRWRGAASHIRVHEVPGARVPFSAVARRLGRAIGHPSTVVLALLLLAAWGVATGLHGIDADWQQRLGTGAALAAVLLLVVAQHMQGREREGLHLKLNELIRAAGDARHDLLDIEELTESELDELRLRYSALARVARGRSAEGAASPERHQSAGPHPPRPTRITAEPLQELRAARRGEPE